MSTFRYRVRREDGTVIEDRADGRDREAVAGMLRRRGVFVIELEEEAKPSRSSARRDILESLRPVGTDDLTLFTRQLATMVEAGIPLVRALGILAGQAESRKLREVVDRVRKEVESGSSLSEALSRQEKVFGRLYVEMARAGEVGGVLDRVLLRIADQLESDRDLRRKVRSALAYPVFVLAFALCAALFMLLFVVPIFAGMYEDLGGTLPLPTRIALGLSGALTGYGGLVLIPALIGGAYFGRRWLGTQQGRDAWGRTILRIPLGIGGVVKKVSLARSTRTLGALTSAGVPILQAMEITATSSGNPSVESALLRSREAVRRGEEIHASLERELVFPAMVVRMVAVGEETGNLDGMLAKVADFYEAEVEGTVKALTSVIEPVMILVVGGVVGSIIVAMYLPMFRIFELIR